MKQLKDKQTLHLHVGYERLVVVIEESFKEQSQLAK
jgi:hypothetical protein